MDRLSDEVVLLIFCELNDPGALSRVSKRYWDFSNDPYVRASYFLSRYGPGEAIYWALGRGKLTTDRVLDILLSSGAHLSRYLVQVAIHHYFRTGSHFIKGTWVRSLPLPVFSYFLKLASDIYGDIPVGKYEDDGWQFQSFLKESRWAPELRTIKWEKIQDMLEKYKFIPFSTKDPLMSQFPLILAVEPRLLPLAVNNGFVMDSKYRDFVFRKMFEKIAVPSDLHMDEMINNVRELCRLDPRMFLSRTVAAEICMEAKTNELAYTVLKKLDRAGNLRFELSTLVEDLLKLFSKTRSVSSTSTILVLRQLFLDFPSSDPTVRLVILLTMFLSDYCTSHGTPDQIQAKLESLRVTPVTRRDIFNVLTSPFVERYHIILDFARAKVGLSEKEVRVLLEEVVVRSLEIGCKGKMLRRLFDNDAYSFLYDTVSAAVMQQYKLDLDDIPPSEDLKACATFRARLGREFGRVLPDGEAYAVDDIEPDADTATVNTESEMDDASDDDDDMEVDVPDAVVVDETQEDTSVSIELGQITQDTLSSRIRQDELGLKKGRRRFSGLWFVTQAETGGRLPYPPDPLAVARWVRSEFGSRSPITAVFMIHAIINENDSILHSYLGFLGDVNRSDLPGHVPVTLKHFKMLAKLGRAPSYSLWYEIEHGAEFFFSEEDYLTPEELSGQPGTVSGKQRKRTKGVKIKVESQSASLPSATASTSASATTEIAVRSRKRPRRSAATSVASYAIPDSDDEAIVDDNIHAKLMVIKARKRKVETNLTRWIKHLSILLKEEAKKYKDKKKAELEISGGIKSRLPKTEFHKSLTRHLRELQQLDATKREQLYGVDARDSEDSDNDDGEYTVHKAPKKKRRLQMAKEE